MTRVQFTIESARALKKRYDLAVKLEEKQFTFEGKEYMTEFAKYVLEYLKQQGLEYDKPTIQERMNGVRR